MPFGYVIYRHNPKKKKKILNLIHVCSVAKKIDIIFPSIKVQPLYCTYDVCGLLDIHIHYKLFIYILRVLIDVCKMCDFTVLLPQKKKDDFFKIGQFTTVVTIFIHLIQMHERYIYRNNHKFVPSDANFY